MLNDDLGALGVTLNKPSELRNRLTQRLARANRHVDSSIEDLSEIDQAEMLDQYESVSQTDSFVTEIDLRPVIDVPTNSKTLVSSNDLLCVTSDTTTNRISDNNKQHRDAIKQGEEEMAEVDTTMLSQEHGSIRHDIAVESARLGAQMGAEACAIRGGQGEIRYDVATRAGDIRHELSDGFGETRFNIAERAGDIRRELADVKDVLNDSTRVEGGSTRFEAAKNTAEIVKEGLKGTHITDLAIKDTRYDLASRVENAADRAERGISELRGNVADRFYSVGRDLSEVRQGQATLSKDIELNALKGVIEGQKNTQYLTDKIVMEAEKTRDLLNDHKYHDLNRSLVERNTELVNCEQDRHNYRDRYWDSRWEQNQNQFGAQFAAMQNQLQSMNQNFNSQLSETRQGMVNFGTMSGNSGQQTSSANNVR